MPKFDRKERAEIRALARRTEQLDSRQPALTEADVKRITLATLAEQGLTPEIIQQLKDKL